MLRESPLFTKVFVPEIDDCATLETSLVFGLGAGSGSESLSLSLNNKDITTATAITHEPSTDGGKTPVHVLEHFANPYEFMASIRRNLATCRFVSSDKQDTPDGFALLEVPNHESLSGVAAGRRWNCFVSYHALQLTPASIKSLLEKSGFKLVHIESVGCSTTQIIGVGLPSIGRRIGIPIKYGWEPNGMLRRVATSFERRLHWGYNLRVIAQRG